MMNEVEKTENSLKDKIKNNLQLLIALGTVIGLVIGVINFFILTAISPIEKRVDALEIKQEKVDEVIIQFIEVKTNVNNIKENVEDIKSYLNIR